MKYFVAVGANLRNPLNAINRACNLLRLDGKVRFLRISDLYKTEPIGPKQSDFLNGVFQVETDLLPTELLRKLLSVENQLGRIRRRKWGPRILDLDLIAGGSLVLKTTKLTLPHPKYHERRFVLVPLCDIAPKSKHPIFGLTHQALLSKLTLQGQRVTIFASWNGKQFSPYKRKRRSSSSSSH